MNVLESLKLKFTSGNSVSVTRAQITDKEYIEVCEIVAHAEYSTADIAGLYDVVSSLGGLKKGDIPSLVCPNIAFRPIK